MIYFDKILHYTYARVQELHSKVILKDFIHKQFYPAENASKLYVFVHPWYTKTHRTLLLKKKLSQSGHAFLEYYEPPAVLSPDYKDTKKYFKTIQKTVIKDIKALKKKHGYSEVNLIGLSLSCVYACMVANGNKDIDNLFLIIPGHCLAESVWQGILTQRVKKALENQGVTLKKLKKYWSDLAPENNIDNIKCKHVYIYLSKADLIIPYYCGLKLKTALQKQKVKLTYEENKFLGHTLSAVYFYINPGRFLFNKKTG